MHFTASPEFRTFAPPIRFLPIMKLLFVILPFFMLLPLHGAKHFFSMTAMRDASTLKVKVLQDWRLVPGEPATRQKLITIKVGDFLPGREYRVPVRMIVPAKGRATGFHLTGGHNPRSMERAAPPRGGAALSKEDGLWPPVR